jgi:hypothetical protein
MDWNRLAAWLDKDDTPDYPKLAQHNIGVVYIDPRSTNVRDVKGGCATHGIIAGIYIAADWMPSWTAAMYADWTSEQLNTFLPRSTHPEAPPCMLDIEKPRGTAWAETFIQAYRKHQPVRPTSYTNEPFQGGLVPVGALALAKMHWYPQMYYGDTLPDGRLRPADAAAVMLEAAREYPAEMVHPFYDGKQLPGDARDGCVFTLGRIPAS